jgi:DNA modification methylase
MADKIIVFGKTFNSEDERKSYFREELRKKLPALKKMEGFPLGEDEDILNLSDAPYYTACPNPWLNDFISEWEEHKKELEKKGKRIPEFEVNEPYASDVSEGKNNPIYNAHSYHTKVPHPAIMRYILHYTQPGDIIFDGFAGTGMTGVAAGKCGNPELDNKFKFENESLKEITWGKRNSICADLSPFASFISSNYNSIDKENFSHDTKEILNKLNLEMEWMYTTNHLGKDCVVNYFIWSEIVRCPNCSDEFPFTQAAVDFNNWNVQDEFNCKNCGTQMSKSNNFVFETISVNDELLKVIKRIPVLKNFSFGKKRLLLPLNNEDLIKLEEIKKIANKLKIKNDFKILPGDKTRELTNKGVYFHSQLFFDRNLIFLDKIKESNVHNSIKFLITSGLLKLTYLNRYTPKLPGPLNGTIYLPSIICEYNPFWSLKGKINSIQKAYNLLNHKSLTSTSSATDISNIKSNQVDYIFTDPPFGENIMYSELNFIHEGFLKIFTNNKDEAIQNRTQLKSLFSYQNLMSLSFSEFYRILKPGKWMTVEFSNTSASVWNSIQTSLQNVGFVISNVTSIDKQQGSFNAVNSVTAVKQDLVISCYKPTTAFDIKFKQNQFLPIAVWDFVEEHLKHLPVHLVIKNSTTAIIERSPKILFDRLIAFYIQKSLSVPIDAIKFQQGLRENFLERDGMFFTQEQILIYDKKKKDNPKFIQLSLLITSEQDGIVWLKNILETSRLAYQDIQPQWMQSLAGARKGDILPELSLILEENFLKDEQGKWYSPNAENETDLEKLRTKRLLKLFEVYKIEASNQRTKLKECRVEALRAGFKQCYQDKDFKTIVTLGDRIPNNLLMEDEVLLQFYDIANSRI